MLDLGAVSEELDVGCDRALGAGFRWSGLGCWIKGLRAKVEEPDMRDRVWGNRPGWRCHVCWI